MFDINDPSLGSNARHVLRQYAEENALTRGRSANAAGTEEFGSGCLRGRYNNLREIIQNNPSLIVVPSIINAGSLFVQRPICRTNYLPNNSMAGATGGVLPTNWSIASLPAGITVSYSASGTAVAADGTSVNYIDVTVSGTAGATGFLNIRPNPSTSTIAAFVGQTYNTSVYLQLISGSVTSISPTWQLQELNSSQTFLQGSNIGGLGSLVVGGPFERYNVSRVLTESASAFVTCRWGHSLVSGTTYSYTLRIGSPQLERFSVPTPMIATSTGAVTRLNESTNVAGLPPDFTVSRNTSATRVNSSGLIETAKTNLALQSAGFQISGTWSPTNITVTTGSTTAFTAPDGSTDADLLTSTASGSARIIQPFSFVSGTTYTYSAFAKAGSGFFGLTMENGGVASGVAVIWNLNTGAFAVSGVVGSGYTLQSQGIENYGNGWYRCRMTVLMSVSVAGNIRANTSNGTMTSAVIQSDNGNSAYVWGAQLEMGSSASEYIPTTTVARTRFAGVTVDGTIAANIPRIDWLGQSCPALLVEPAATNFARWVNQMTAQDTPAASGGMTITTGSTDFLAPDGTSGSITKYVGGAASGTSQGAYYSGGGITVTASGQHTFSLFVKRGATNPLTFCALGFEGFAGGSGTIYSYFNLASGTAITAGASVQDYGNGWYRLISAPYTIASGDLNGQLAFFMAEGNGDLSWPASGALGLTAYIWGAQLEAGSVATSYIPTTSGTGSRAADNISASVISELIGQTEGTIYIECESNDGEDDVFAINRSVNNGIALYKNANNGYLGRIHHSTNMITFQSSNNVTGMVKIAIAYKSGDSTMYLNGLRVGTLNTSAITFGAALNSLSVNKSSAYFSGIKSSRIRAAALYTTRLSDEQLQHLTSFYEPEYDNINLWNAFTQRYSNPDPCLYNRLCALLY